MQIIILAVPAALLLLSLMGQPPLSQLIIGACYVPFLVALRYHLATVARIKAQDAQRRGRILR